MAKLRIAVLYDIWYDDSQEEPPEGKPSRRKKKPDKEDRQEIHEALREAGHSPFYVSIDGTRESLAELAKTECDLIFNLTASWAGDDTKDIHLAAYLDLCGFKYTGAGPFGLHLSQNKSLAKKIFAFHGIRTPFFAAVYRGRLDWAHDDLSFPVIVKPAREDGSIGIEFNAVCESIKELMERIHDIHEKFDSPALIEEYIEGREIYVTVLGNENPIALPVVELDMSKLPEGTPRIAGTEVKWRTGSEAYKKTKSVIPTDLDEKVGRKLQEVALAAYQAVELRDYGRIDMRLAADGKIYVLEVNPNPWLQSKAEVALAAKESGRTYPALIEEIVNLAQARYGP
ncbi:MAG TPA: ATP-grasp domain-containing protein [Candidatus Polarisedimenticolia bacterium]|jgi:D-alanine-D-alanine ligase|nr:ATP-grasp domain-containing protein [Candidatus Polarisedimenticolia bacterium]